MRKNNNWILNMTILGFFITILFSTISNIVLSDLNIIFGIIIIFIFIFVGVVFDMIGVAVASSSCSVFNSMASKKVNNSKLAIKIVRDSPRVASFCNDVIGDICNIMSGSAGLVVAINIANKYEVRTSIVILLVASVIAALTIGGKAYGKEMAIKNSDKIVFRSARILNMLKRYIK